MYIKVGLKIKILFSLKISKLLKEMNVNTRLMYNYTFKLSTKVAGCSGINKYI